jgi:type II secretory pathway component PulK
MIFSARGSILVFALWALMMLSIFSLSLSSGVRQRATLLDRLTTLDALYPIAYSGVESAKSLVKSDLEPSVDTLTDSWAGSVSKNVGMANGYFWLGSAKHPGLVDEERKINLNAANAGILYRLFQAVAGLDRERAEEVVYCLLDWMDSDSFFGHPKYGAEASYYEDLRLPYSAKNKPYELLDEMLLVRSMTPDLFEKVKPFVTVYGSGKVNINTASGEVLHALGFSTTGVETIARYRAGKDAIDGTSDDNFFTSVKGILADLNNKGETPLDVAQAAVLDSLLTASRLDVSSTFFSVKSHAVLTKNNASLDIDAVIDRRGNVYYCRASEAKL